MRDGTFDDQGSSRFEQSLLAIDMMSRLLTQLRDEGKYDNSLIIFQSDHGTPGRPPVSVAQAEPSEVMPESLHQQITRTNMGGRSGRGIDLRTKALLLVKPPGNRQQKLRRIDQLAQLLDLDALIMNVVPAPRGADNVSIALDTMRRQSVRIYNGYRQKDRSDGTQVVFGKRFTRGFWSVYLIDEDGRWQVQDRLPVRW